jgi:beta-lactam-binding protein with PASTA domain/tRNA A-37 threonylcarbamoyl transferase component Bud32
VARVARVFSNRYEVVREIARGGMAEVYLARDQLLDRPVAIKVLSSEYARDPTFVERFRREAQAAANLNHPNIVAIYDWGQEQGTYFIVMEYVAGQSLRDLLGTRGRLPPTEAAQIAAQIAAALAFANRNGVVHRDIKPGNVLIDDDGKANVADFGIARGPATDNLTQTGSVMGTANYFSPEQAQGQPVDGRSDVYSLGVVLYEMVTGRTPFTGDTAVSVAYQHVREEPVPPSAIVPELPAAMEHVIMHALAKNPAARYQTADELRADLIRFERGQPVTAIVAGTGATAAVTQVAGATQMAQARPEPPPPPKRRRTGAIIAAVIGLAALAGLVLWILLTGSDNGGENVTLVDVPDVVNQNVSTAVPTLENLGFVVVQEADNKSTQPAGTVLAQDPEGGRRLEVGGTVTLTVSGEEVKVPDVVSLDVSQAEQRLRSLGFQVAQMEEDSEESPGTVLAQNPAAKSLAARGSTVTLTVAREPTVPVPNVVGQTQTAATNTLQAAGLRVSVQETPSDSPAGQVVSQNPTGGTDAPRDTTVTITVSTGPQQVPVPNVVGQTEAAATNALEAAGFLVQVQLTPSSQQQNGLVIQQSPAADSEADEGSTVTILVGTGP